MTQPKRDLLRPIFVAAVVMGTVALVVSATSPVPVAETDETPGGNVSDAPAYDNESCVPGLVGDGSGCLDGDQDPDTPVGTENDNLYPRHHECAGEHYPQPDCPPLTPTDDHVTPQ